MTSAPSTRFEEIIDLLQQRASLYLLAPSSHLGLLFIPPILTALRQRVPALEIVAVDDLYARDGRVLPGIQRLLSSNAFAAEAHAGLAAVNFGASPNTWLTFQSLAGNAGIEAWDLPEMLYALDIPLVYETGRTTRTLAALAAPRLQALRGRLADELSRKTLDAITAMRESGRRDSLLDVLCPAEQEYFSFYRTVQHPIGLSNGEHYVDIGTYDGDTLRKFLLAGRGEYASINAFEPDPANFTVLQRNFPEGKENLVLHNLAVSDTNTPLRFSAKGTMGSRVQADGDIHVPSVRLDDILENITLLKMDVEGHEASVLRGAGNLIRACRPRMAITCYHHVRDLLDIVETIDTLLPDAQLRLRHYSLYFYDTILYVE